MIAEHDAIQPNTLTTSESDYDDAAKSPAGDDPGKSPAGDKIGSHEEAAHEKRNWVRLSYDCNNHCIFCLDTLAHNGTMRSNMDVKVQIVEGRKKGATRLILSGGEPTMHPNFLDFVKLGKRAGYRRVQTVTNGRMFSYPEFLQTASDNGLDEITFSLHGHTPKLHDALVGTPGAFVQEVAGLKAALASERFIVNVDVVINKMNVKHLPEMLETFIGWGVREFDLLHIIPFGNAWGAAKEHLFYDLEGNEEPLRKAMEYSKRPDIHIWLNRFPPPYTEGFEELIQDPYKLNDEVRGRREEYDRYLSIGEKLHCRQPERCRYCYLNQLCDTLDVAIEERKKPVVDVLRIAEPAPIAGQLPRARAAHVIARDLESAKALIERAEPEALWLELERWDGIADALSQGRIFGRLLERCYVRRGEDLAPLLALDDALTVVAYLSTSTAPAIEQLGSIPERLMVAQPNYDRVTEQHKHDLPDLRAFCQKLPPHVKSENIPPCIGGRLPEERGDLLDATMLGADSRIDMGKYAQAYVKQRFYTKSRRCKQCSHDSSCAGVHINFVRAHRYAVLQPIQAGERGER